MYRIEIPDMAEITLIYLIDLYHGYATGRHRHEEAIFVMNINKAIAVKNLRVQIWDGDYPESFKILGVPVKITNAVKLT